MIISFVENFCKENEVSFKALKADVPKISKGKGMGIEECAREIRYDFFSSFTENENDRIVTAHTLSDLAETMAFRFITGTSVKGLVGIAPKRNNIVRPLIKLTREEIEEYCKENGISYVTDSTNLSDEYTRNFIRHQIIPKMKEINPSFEERAFSLSKNAGEDEAFIEEFAKKLVNESKTENGYSCKPFLCSEKSVAVRAIRLILEKEKVSRPTFVQLSSCLDVIKKGEGKVSLSGNVSLVCEFSVFRIAENLAEENTGFSYNIEFEKPFLIPGGEFVIKIMDKNEYFSKKSQKINNLLLIDAFNYDIISNGLLIRNRIQGDKFTPKGRKITKTLKKLFNEAKIPKEQREKLAVLSENENIIWVEKFGISELYKITEKTEKVAVIMLNK